MSAIEIKDLSIGYRNRKNENAIHTGLNLTLEAGKLTCILGKNGSGKSTLLKTLCGFIPALGGSVTINGKPAIEYSSEEFSKTVGVVLTENTNAGGLTVRELVALGRYPYSGYFGQLDDYDNEVIEKAMNDVNISHKSSHYVSELSDGERQKAFIAKVLAQECPIIILDEPTSFLDVTSRIDVLFLMKDIAARQHKAVLLSTHDIEIAVRLADILWLMPEKCNINVTKGSPKELISNGNLENLFNFGADLEKNKIVKETLGI